MIDLAAAYVAAEIHRVEGNLLLTENSRRQPKPATSARSNCAPPPTWRGGGPGAAKRQKAAALLAPVYSCFTGGFGTADLKDAKALLDELA